MAQFQLLRYLKKWQLLIVAVCVLGCLGVYLYCNRAQGYSANAVIKYTHEKAIEGFNPDGSVLDATEMISAAVIADVINDLGLSSNVESIRSHFQITAIVPSEELEKQAAYLAVGKEYAYNPVIYQIRFSVGSKSSAEYARTVLDSLLSHYFTYYCKKYVTNAAFSNKAANISAATEEYVDCVEILSTTLDDSIYYLESRAEGYPSFYSAITGYSFGDLADCYQYIKDNDLARLNAYVQENRLVKNRELLLERYKNNINQCTKQIDSLKAEYEESIAIIRQFSQKTLDDADRYVQSESDSRILSTVDSDSNRLVYAETTYDQLMNQCTNLLSSRIVQQCRLKRLEELQAVFENATADTDAASEQAAQAVALIEKTSERIDALYEIALQTIAEFNETKGAEHMAMLTSVVAGSQINIIKYMLLAVVAFICIGCGLAVVVGRAGDFVSYYLFADRRTGLPNRARCDMVIEQFAKEMLPDAFCCFAIQMKLHSTNRPDMMRRHGDELLERFGKVLIHVFGDVAFVGYNGNGMFVVFLGDCSTPKANALEARLEQFAAAVCDVVINYSVGHAVTTSDNCYNIRGLLRLAISRYTEVEPKESGVM